MRQGNIILGNFTRDFIMNYFINQVDETQEGVQFHWQGRVLITIEPTNEGIFHGGEKFFDELWFEKHGKTREEMYRERMSRLSTSRR